MNPVIAGLVRHLLTFGGGFLVAKGYLDNTLLEEGVAAVITIVGIVWSVVHKKKVEKEING